MNTERSGFMKRFLIMLLFSVILTAFTGGSVMAEQLVNIQEGTYYIKAVNGNAKGQVLYWNESASDQNTCMMFESCGGSHAENEVWYITKNRNFDDFKAIKPVNAKTASRISVYGRMKSQKIRHKPWEPSGFAHV